MAKNSVYLLSENNFKVSGLKVSDLVQQLDSNISLVSISFVILRVVGWFHVLAFAMSYSVVVLKG